MSTFSVTIHNPDLTLTSLPKLAPFQVLHLRPFEEMNVFHVQTTATEQANCTPKEI